MPVEGCQRSSFSLGQENTSSYEPQYVGASCDEKRCRTRKIGYDHPAAMSTMKQILRTKPQPHQRSKRVDPCRHAPAGVGSNRLTQIKRHDHVTCVDNGDFRQAATFSGCRQKMTDPITHKRPSAGGQCLADAEIEGAAGQPSSRMTELNNCKLTHHRPPARGPRQTDFNPPSRTHSRTDTLLAHDPNRGWEKQNDGIRRFKCKGVSKVPMEHRDKQPLQPQTQEDIQESGGLRRQKEVVHANGVLQLSVAGDGNTLPTSTKSHLSSDMKVSRCAETYRSRGCA